jgi:hypothetical protein
VHLLSIRYFLSLGNVAFSMLLGVLALAACAIYNEQLLLSMLKQASNVREWIVSFSGAPKMEIIARFVLHESSILLMFFTLMARVVVGFVIAFISFLFGGSAREHL